MPDLVDQDVEEQEVDNSPPEETAESPVSAETPPAAPEAPASPPAEAPPPEEGRTLPGWAAVRDQWMGAFPALSEDRVRGTYEGIAHAADWRARVQNSEETTGSWLYRRVLPVASAQLAIRNAGYVDQAQQRIAAGQGTAEDAEVMAVQNRLAETDANASTGTRVAGAIAGIPAVLGEAYLGGRLLGPVARAFGIGAAPASGLRAAVTRFAGGAVTAPLMPSLYAERAISNNREAGRESTDWRGYPAAITLAAIQNGVFSTVGTNAVGGGPGAIDTARRVFSSTARGMALQQGMDIGTSALDDASHQVFGSSMNLTTHYGLLGSLVRGQGNDALRDGMTQAVTFALFAGLHEAQNRPGPVQPQSTALTLIPRTVEGLPPESPLARQRVEVRGVTPNRAPVETPVTRRLAGPEIMEGTKTFLDEMGRQGLSPEHAGVNLRTVTSAVGELLTNADRQGTTREAARNELTKQFPPGPAREYALHLVERLSGFSEMPNRRPEPRQEPRQELATTEPAAREMAEPTRELTAPPEAPAAPTEAVPAERQAVPPSTGGQITTQTAPEALAVAKTGVPGQSLAGLWERFQARREIADKVKAGEPVSQAEQGIPPVTMGEIAQAAKLNPREAHILFERMSGRTLDSIAKDRAVSGQGLSRERVRQLEAKAREKAGIPESIWATLSAEKPEQTGAVQIGEVSFTREQMKDPALQAAVRRAKSPLSPREAKAKAIEEITNHVIKGDVDAANQALERASRGPLSPADHQAISDFANQHFAEIARQGQPAAPGSANAGIASRGSSPRAQVQTGQPAPGSQGLQAGAKVPHARSLTEATGGQTFPASRQAKWTPAHEAFHTKISSSLKGAGLPVEKQAEYRTNLKATLANYNEKYIGLLDQNLQDTSWHTSTRALTDALAAVDPQVAALQRSGRQAGGAFDRSTGILDVDGDAPSQGRKQGRTGREIKAHEFGHVIDGANLQFSSTPEWNAAHAKEAWYLGSYAETSPQESFAEYSRLVGMGTAIDALRENMPAMTSIWENAGILGEGGKRSFEQPEQIFDQAVNTGTKHTDMLRQRMLSPAEEVKKFLAEESGHLDMDVIRNVAEQYGANALRAVQHVRHSVAELAGVMGPRTTKLNRAAGEALARFNVADTYGRFFAPVLTEKVLGPNSSLEFRHKVGGVLTEWRLQHMKDYYTRTDAGAATRVKSIIGQPNSPFKTKGEFLAASKDPEVLAAVDRYVKHVTPVMDEAFRRSQGMEVDDPIDSPTQLPGAPLNLKANRDGETTANTVRTKEGNLRNEKLNKNKFANQAYGDAEHGYDTDISNIIEHSITHQLSNAAKAEAISTLVDRGVAHWGKPGESHEFSNVMSGASGRGVRFDVKPPPGTQASLAGETSLYVHPEAAGELRRALQVDEPLNFKTINAAMRLLTTATIASTAEITYHTKNQLSFLMKPGMRPHQIFGYFRDVVMKKPEIMDRLVELARIGTMKEHGLEGGVMGGKYNPFKYGGKFLDLTRKVLALMGDDAYDRLVSAGLAKDTQTGRRNFINQLGQYNKFAAHKVVKFLRDTQIGPFATAGVNAPIQAVRAVFGGHGVETTSAKADLQLRAATIAKYIGVFATTSIINSAIWGLVTGSDDTPFGGIRVGTSPDGRSRYIDVLDLVGLKRGLRVMGLLAVMEGKRHHDPAPVIADRAAKDVINAVIHPAAGPGVQFGLTSAFGVDARGFRTVPRAVQGEQSQIGLNVKTAAMHANPLVNTLFGEENKDKPAFEKTMELLGPFGIHTAPRRR